jgi:hypothetical protein
MDAVSKGALQATVVIQPFEAPRLDNILESSPVVMYQFTYAFRDRRILDSLHPGGCSERLLQALVNFLGKDFVTAEDKVLLGVLSPEHAALNQHGLSLSDRIDVMQLAVIAERLLECGVISPDHPQKKQTDDAETEADLLAYAQTSGPLAHYSTFSPFPAGPDNTI